MVILSEDSWINWVDTLSNEDYIVHDGIFPENVLEGLRDALKKHISEKDFKKALIGTQADKQLNSEIRSDNIFWLDKNDPDKSIRFFFDFAEEYKHVLNRYCYLNISDYEFHMAHYPEGSFYKKHLDQFKERNNRVISTILYLNKNWESSQGGELKIYLEDDVRIIEPKYGRIVSFKSDLIEHEVMKTNVDRFSITGWMLHNPVGLGFLGNL